MIFTLVVMVGMIPIFYLGNLYARRGIAQEFRKRAHQIRDVKGYSSSQPQEYCDLADAIEGRKPWPGPN